MKWIGICVAQSIGITDPAGSFAPYETPMTGTPASPIAAFTAFASSRSTLVLSSTRAAPPSSAPDIAPEVTTAM